MADWPKVALWCCAHPRGTMSLLNVDSREKLVIFGKIYNFAAKNLESKKSFSHNWTRTDSNSTKISEKSHEYRSKLLKIGSISSRCSFPEQHSIKFHPKLSQKKESPPLLKLLPFPVSRATSKKKHIWRELFHPRKKTSAKRGSIAFRAVLCSGDTSFGNKISVSIVVVVPFPFFDQLQLLSLFSTRGFWAKRTIETSTGIWRQTRLESSSSTCLPLYLFFSLPSIRPGLG